MEEEICDIFSHVTALSQGEEPQHEGKQEVKMAAQIAAKIGGDN